MKRSEAKVPKSPTKPRPGTLADYELALREGAAKINRSKKSATEFLKRAGILDKNGKTVG